MLRAQGTGHRAQGTGHRAQGTGFIVFPFLLLCSSVARADLPLTIEDLITGRGQFKLDISLTYANAEQQGIVTGSPVVVQTGATSFITIPTLIGERRGNIDTFVSAFGLRYGLTEKTELYTRLSHLHMRQRNSAATGNYQSSESHFADAWLGINYQFKQDTKTPALLGFSEIALHEKHYISSSSFKTFLLGLTTYKAIDPVVFSLTGAYRINRSRKDGDVDYQPGNLLLLNPSIGFAVNERVTLTTGVQWVNRPAYSLNDEKQGIRHTQTDLLLGVSYGFNAKNTININLKSNASGQAGADLRLSWLHQF